MPRYTTLDEFLADEGILEEVNARTAKRLLALELEEARKQAGLSKAEIARRMETSRAQVDRILSADSTGMSIETLDRFAAVLGRKLSISLLPS